MKRNERITIISNMLSTNPSVKFSFPYFCKIFDCAKSSISEDIEFIRNIFKENRLGEIVTTLGAGGGVEFLPNVKNGELKDILFEIEKRLNEEDRFLLKEFIYYGDILHSPKYLNAISNAICSNYYTKNITGVMTIETKGIPIAVDVARKLNAKIIVARKVNTISEGNTNSVHYKSGSSNKVKSMYVTKKSILKDDNILIVDDYIKGGGTVSGMIKMIKESDANFVDAFVFIDEYPEVKKNFKYKSMYTMKRDPFNVSLNKV